MPCLRLPEQHKPAHAPLHSFFSVLLSMARGELRRRPPTHGSSTALQQLALLRCRGGRGLVNILLLWREEETTELISFVCRPRSTSFPDRRRRRVKAHSQVRRPAQADLSAFQPRHLSCECVDVRIPASGLCAETPVRLATCQPPWFRDPPTQPARERGRVRRRLCCRMWHGRHLCTGSIAAAVRCSVARGPVCEFCIQRMLGCSELSRCHRRRARHGCSSRATRRPGSCHTG